MQAADLALVGDIGATNARFALVAPDRTLSKIRGLLCDDYPTIGAAIAAYLREAGDASPARAVLAIAAAPSDDAIAMTNHPWHFSIAALREELSMRSLKVVNDFHATAMAVPHLLADDLKQIGPGAPLDGAPIGVIGPGTGLGISALVPSSGGMIPVSGEGGHQTMSPADARESAVLDVMRSRYDHVSAERLLSGPGLVNLYNTLCEISRRPAAPLAPAQITDPG
jgi:glucokinase